MHPMAARAFLNKLLNVTERMELRRTERNLPPGRYLQGSEICRIFNLKPDSLPEEETDKMEALWGHYGRTDLRLALQFEDEHPEVIPKTKAEEVHAWEDFALTHYS